MVVMIDRSNYDPLNTVCIIFFDSPCISNYGPPQSTTVVLPLLLWSYCGPTTLSLLLHIYIRYCKSIYISVANKCLHFN